MRSRGVSVPRRATPNNVAPPSCQGPAPARPAPPDPTPPPQVRERACRAARARESQGSRDVPARSCTRVPYCPHVLWCPHAALQSTRLPTICTSLLSARPTDACTPPCCINGDFTPCYCPYHPRSPHVPCCMHIPCYMHVPPGSAARTRACWTHVTRGQARVRSRDAERSGAVT